MQRAFNGILVAVLLLAWPRPAAAEFLTTPERKQAFLTQLDQAMRDVAQARQDHEASRGPVEARARALFQEAESLNPEQDPNANEKQLNVMIRVVCDPQINHTMGILRGQYFKGWEYFQAWAGPVRERLSTDPVKNPYLWYGRYDFEAALVLLREFHEILFDGRKKFVESVCRDLEANLFQGARRAAKGIDEVNRRQKELEAQAAEVREAGRAAAEGGDEARAEALKTQHAAMVAQGEELKRRGREGVAQMRQFMGGLQGAFARQSVDLKVEMDRLMARLADLKVPERGQLDRSRTRPRELRARDGATFVLRLFGKLIPGGLQPADIGHPQGLEILGVSGGGERLDLHFRKLASLAEGRHELSIAGEALPFSYRKPDSATNAPANPLVATGNANQPPANFEAEVPEDGRGTDLTPVALREYPQELFGYWGYGKEHQDSPEDAGVLFEITYDQDGQYLLLLGHPSPPFATSGLEPHMRVGVEDLGGTLGQYKPAGGACFAGLRTTKEREPDQCQEYRWWEPSRFCFQQPENLASGEVIKGRTHERESCETNDQSYDLDVGYERFDGVSFVPVQGNKYIGLSGVAAPAKYEARVKLQWDYSALGAQRMNFVIRSKSRKGPILHQGVYTDLSQATSYDFVTQRAGVYYFDFELIDAFDKVAHRDTARAIIPGIPGLGG